jgi:hypothetical protein
MGFDQCGKAIVPVQCKLRTNGAICDSLRTFLINRHMNDTNSLIEQRKAKLS